MAYLVADRGEEIDLRLRESTLAMAQDAHDAHHPLAGADGDTGDRADPVFLGHLVEFRMLLQVLHKEGLPALEDLPRDPLSQPEVPHAADIAFAHPPVGGQG